MPSAEGHGRARARVVEFLNSYFAFDVTEVVVDMTHPPSELVKPFDQALTPRARAGVQGFSADLVGFWVLWQAEGGFEGLRRFGMSDATIWRRIRAFRDAFGAHPDDFELPGVSVDLGEYWLDPRWGPSMGHFGWGAVD